MLIVHRRVTLLRFSKRLQLHNLHNAHRDNRYIHNTLYTATAYWNAISTHHSDGQTIEFFGNVAMAYNARAIPTSTFFFFFSGVSYVGVCVLLFFVFNMHVFLYVLLDVRFCSCRPYHPARSPHGHRIRRTELSACIRAVVYNVYSVYQLAAAHTHKQYTHVKRIMYGGPPPPARILWIFET